MKLGYGIVSALIFTSLLHAGTRLIEPVKSQHASFAIIIDSTSFSRTEEAVLAYRNSIEDDGLSTYIMISDWRSADAVKSEIIRLKDQDDRFEGFVLVGDIPIPMIRDAQHLTSAFKIDQNAERYTLIQTSVPSDRFYDDLDLRFTYVQQDTTNPLLFYYRLDPDSPQKIESDLYSGRIKAPIDDETKYKRLKACLNRIADQKKIGHQLDQGLLFSGHGYHSESLDAWASEFQSMREIFPQFFIPGGYLRNYYHEMDAELKEVLIHELQDPELDLGIFHAHGDDDVQYLLGIEPASTIGQHVESIKKFLRSKLRQAERRKKSVEEAKEYYQTEYDIPDTWFAGALSDSLRLADSIWAAKQDLYAQDVRDIAPKVKVLYLDECFNGAFFRTPYQAGEYIFNEQGNTFSVIANSVNVLQDIWADEQLGLLSYGIRLGQWRQYKNYLEVHIIGDPTFHFKSKENTDFQDLLAENDAEDLLESESAALRALGIEQITFDDHSQLISLMEEIILKDPAGIVRLQALKRLVGLQVKNLNDIFVKTVDDPYELIRRLSVIWMGDIGTADFLPFLIERMVEDVSSRVRFNAKKAVEKIGTERRYTEFEQLISDLRASEYKSQLKELTINSFKRSDEWLHEDLIPRLRNKDLPLKKRLSAARTFRNYRFHQAVPELIEIVADSTQDTQLRESLTEALGWYVLSYQRDKILGLMDSLLKDEETPESLKHVARMTRNRLLSGLNNPITP